jgi:hypothetical protein
MKFWPFRSAVQKHIDSSIEEKIYEQVAREIQANDLRPGLWTKALVETGGDKEKARLRYIALRARSIADEIQAHREMTERLTRAAAVEIRRNIPCPGCRVTLTFKKAGELHCRCPRCKKTFRVDSANRVYDIGSPGTNRRRERKPTSL